MTAQTVWKYPIPLTDSFALEMPAGARVVAVQMQGDTPCLWAFVAPDAPLKERHFRLSGTGHPITEAVIGHVGTLQMAGGRLVFHVFEVRP